MSSYENLGGSHVKLDISTTSIKAQESISHPTEHSVEEEVIIPAKRKPFSFWVSFFALTCTVFIVSLDSTALAVAIPIITHDLNGTTFEAFWTNISFLLAVVISQPLYTNISDVIGRKIPLHASFTLFLAGSILFALSSTMTSLILGRLLQGLGGGGLDVLGEIILADITTLKERPLYLGLYALPMAGGGVCGPIIGASFATYVSWRWIGWINLPLIGIGWFLSTFLKLKPLTSSVKDRLKRLDWTGLMLFTIGSSAITLPLSWAGSIYPWSSWQTLLCFLLGICVLVVFAVYEKRPQQPVFPYRIVGSQDTIFLLIAALAHGGCFYGIILYAPLFFQSVLQQTAFRSSISILPAGVCIVFFSIIGAVLIEGIRKYRVIITLSALLLPIGLALWTLWDRHSSNALLYGLMVIPSIGAGMLFMTLPIPMSANVSDPADMGLAAGVLVSFRLFGALISLSICSMIFEAVFSKNITAVTFLPSSLELLSQPGHAIQFIPNLIELNLPSVMLDDVLEVYKSSFIAIFWTLASFGVVCLGSAIFIKEKSIEHEQMGRQAFDS